VRAEAETLHPTIESFLVSSPVARIFTIGRTPPTLRIRFFSNNTVGSMVAPFSNTFKADRFIGDAFFSKDLKRYPRSFGSFFIISRISGRRLLPARAV